MQAFERRKIIQALGRERTLFNDLTLPGGAALGQWRADDMKGIRTDSMMPGTVGGGYWDFPGWLFPDPKIERPGLGITVQHDYIAVASFAVAIFLVDHGRINPSPESEFFYTSTFATVGETISMVSYTPNLAANHAVPWNIFDVSPSGYTWGD